jgi:hypothetical protein
MGAKARPICDLTDDFISLDGTLKAQGNHTINPRVDCKPQCFGWSHIHGLRKSRLYPIASVVLSSRISKSRLNWEVDLALGARTPQIKDCH